jgi:hypothetical protein
MNFESVDPISLKFQHPFTCLLVGPTKSGKTLFTYKFIHNASKLVTPSPQRIYFVYSEWQPLYNQMVHAVPNLKMVEGMIDLAELKKDPETPKLLIIDDMMSEMAKNETLNIIFTRGAHHWSTSVIFIVQNLFFSGIKNARLNSHYIILFKSPDQQQVNCLARQLYPGRVSVLMDAYKDAISEKYNPLLIDMTNDIDEKYRLRAHIFPDEHTIIYKLKRL